MIVYYAPGGGLGHLTRGRRVLETLGLHATIVTTSSHARDARIAGAFPTIEIPQHLEHNLAAHREWIARLDAERLIVDTFPGGIQGELCDLDVPMDLVARLLRWNEYRRVVPNALPTFETAWMLEELEPEHDAWVRANSKQTMPLTLTIASGEAAASESFWLIVHSGPDDEVRELIAYASELRAVANEQPEKILVATRCSVELPSGFEAIDVYPAAMMFARASRIISAAGFNVMLETEPHRDKHVVIPFPRRFDDQFQRAARRRTVSPA